MTLPEMLDELPKACDVGGEKERQGRAGEVGRLQAAYSTRPMAASR